MAAGEDGLLRKLRGSVALVSASTLHFFHEINDVRFNYRCVCFF